MIRAAASRSTLLSNARSAATNRCRKLSSTSSSPLQGDAGALATHVHHKVSLGLIVVTPVFFLVPDSMTDGFLNKAFGVALSGAISMHSFVGLNYVATDYVPKISKNLVGPARILNAGLAAVTFLGLSKISVSSEGGIKGCLKGLWNPPQKK